MWHVSLKRHTWAVISRTEMTGKQQSWPTFLHLHEGCKARTEVDSGGLDKRIKAVLFIDTDDAVT